jgi:hypothetical protein
MRIVLVGIALTALLVACGEQKKDVKDTVFAPQIEAKEKARAVEDKLKAAAEKNAEPYQKQEGY